MNFNKVILMLVIGTLVIFMSLIGFSYAWYAANNAQTNFNISTPNLSKIQTTFTTSEYINNNYGIPISDANVASLADRNSFSIIAKENMSAAASYTIYIDEISIDTDLKSSDFKWELLKNNVSVANGNFANIGSLTKISLYTTSLILHATTPDAYELRVWIRDTGVSQNNMMGKSFSGRIKVEVYITR